MRARPLLVRTAAVLCLVVASCSSGGGAAKKGPGTSSTLSPPDPAATGAGDGNGPDPGQSLHGPDRASALPGSGPSGPRGTGPDRKQSFTSTTTGGGATTTTAVPAGLPPERCPDAKTCRRYIFGDGNADASKASRWPAGPDGSVTIHYSINPANSGLPDEQVRGAIGAAFATWQAAAPRLRFVFDGFTSRPPTPGDGHNDIGWAPGSTYAFPQPRDRVMVEADMLFSANAGDGWTWTPCEQRDGSCTRTCTPGSVTECRSELQAIATHEAGHWLWLGDMAEEPDRELTMNPDFPFHDRFRSTLALGDVLGVRALYPCSCPLPPIHSP